MRRTRLELGGWRGDEDVDVDVNVDVDGYGRAASLNQAPLLLSLVYRLSLAAGARNVS